MSAGPRVADAEVRPVPMGSTIGYGNGFGYGYGYGYGSGYGYGDEDGF